MTQEPKWKKVGASTYACTVCPNFKIEVIKNLNAGELKKRLGTRLAAHIKTHHRETLVESEYSTLT